MKTIANNIVRNNVRQCQAKTKRQENVGKQMNKKNKYAYQLAIE